MLNAIHFHLAQVIGTRFPRGPQRDAWLRWLENPQDKQRWPVRHLDATRALRAVLDDRRPTAQAITQERAGREARQPVLFEHDGAAAVLTECLGISGAYRD
jgi:hypothetical protein